jgi:hypothetical protein
VKKNNQDIDGVIGNMKTYKQQGKKEELMTYYANMVERKNE